MGKKIRLIPAGLTFSHSQRGAYALILTEENGQRRLPIIIGGFEAQAIAIELEKMKPPRPLTHDLFLNLAESFDIQLQQVLIHELKEGIFYAKLVCKSDDKEVELDSRTSDAIALSLRFGCPIYTYEEILAEAGIVLENKEINIESEEEQHADPKDIVDSDTPSEVPKSSGNELAGLSMQELKDLMQKAIEDEDYEKASLVRDEINKRKED